MTFRNMNHELGFPREGLSKRQASGTMRVMDVWRINPQKMRLLRANISSQNNKGAQYGSRR